MTSIAAGSESFEYVSQVALDILDEMRLRVLECWLALEYLPEEARLNFEELEEGFAIIGQDLRTAHEAAALVHASAPLADRWGANWSRPTAIFARHNEAVREGAAKVWPVPGAVEEIWRALSQLSRIDHGQQAAGFRTTCAGVVRTTGERCQKSVMYLGSGIFGSNCYSHSAPGERVKFKVHNDATAARQAGLLDDLLAKRRRLGATVVDEWMRERADRDGWVGEETWFHGEPV